ncbi:proline racemase family protein [Paracoccus beibuensis]|uniref:proline racemase family protein n=1 Tax=Paracoccus beibuensis TaxID=547602 RepID=UPI002240A2E0|nr:proline racemase family protein [Paracoccus beibuensis]
MTADQSLDILLVHCQGESGNVLISDVPEIPGTSILNKMNHLNDVDPSLDLFLTREPRAQAVHITNWLLPSIRHQVLGTRPCPFRLIPKPVPDLPCQTCDDARTALHRAAQSAAEFAV